MLSQLIKMVGKSQVEQQEMKQDLQGVKQDQKNMQEKLQELETKGEERHKEARFTAIVTDQNFIWEKAAKNERDIAQIKGQLR